MKFGKVFFALIMAIFTLPSFMVSALEIGAALPVYSESQLIRLFETNSHLHKVKAIDDCQLLQDIEARAIRVELPAYQFLYGDMLAWGVCIDRDVEQGLYYMRLAAKQGLPAALEQIGRYYAKGTLVQQDKERAIYYLREASSLDNMKAKLQFAQLLIEDHGSPLDYEDAYRWLYKSVTADRNVHLQITKLRRGLEARMPGYAIDRAKKRATFW